MPKAQYVLPDAEPRRLVASWTGKFDDFTLSLDDEVVLSAPSGLASDRRCTLPDGRSLRVVLQGDRLTILLEGTPLAAAGGGPERTLTIACFALYALAAGSLLLAAAALVRPDSSPPFLAIEAGVGGALFAVLGRLVHTRRSRVALRIALVLCGLDAVATVVLTVTAPRDTMPVLIAAFLVKLALFLLSSRARRALELLELRRRRSAG